MSNQPENEPAFPISELGQYGGLSKREYIAAMAMQGAVANPNRHGSPQEYAEFARMCAAALLAELAK